MKTPEEIMQIAAAAVAAIAARKREICGKDPTDESTFMYASGCVDGAARVLKAIQEAINVG